MAEIICNVNIETYWCELCSEYTICNRAERWMEKHGFVHTDGYWNRGRLIKSQKKVENE